MPTSSQQRRLDAWNNRLTPEERDYDRFVAGQIPQGASWSAETTWGKPIPTTRRSSRFDHA